MKRQDVPIELTWNLDDIYASMEEYRQSLDLLMIKAKALENLDIEAMETSELGELLRSYENYIIRSRLLKTYLSLHLSVEMTSDAFMKEEAELLTLTSEQSGRLSYIEGELHKLPVKKLKEVAKEFPGYKVYLDQLLRERPHRLGDETEEAFEALTPLFLLPYKTYQMIKLADMDFPDFEVEGKSYPMSYVLYENSYCYSEDTKLRRAAYECFYSTIGKYSYGMGSGYLTNLETEKTMSRLRGFKSVTDYMLLDQQVERKIYETHLETMM